jgi:hypothetical protein
MYICSIYSHVLCLCEQDTVVIVPPYPYCIEEHRNDVALEHCWYARPMRKRTAVGAVREKT